MARRILIVGLGSIGRRHLANLRAIAPEADVTLWRHSTPEGDPKAPPGVDQVVYTPAEALASQPEAAIVAGPATSHIAIASLLVEQGIPIFVEKPISDTLDGLEDLLTRCRARGVLLMVGYNLRFHPPLRALRNAVRDGRIGRVLSIRAEVGQYLPDWRPNADYRRGVSARRDLGGGAVLELSHELDYVRWIVGDVRVVMAQIARVSDLDIEVEDTAEIILGFRNGATGSVHLDMTQRVMRRSCWVAGTGGTIAWDAPTHSVRLYEAQTRSWTDVWPVAALDRNEMYLAELREFFDCLANGRSPAVTGEDGQRALEIALAAKESSRTMRAVELRTSMPNANIVGGTAL
jgi:predicted dehydrogenase